MVGVAKILDPSAEFATAWPLEAGYSVIYVTGSSQCCPQSETLRLKKMCKVLVGRIKLVGGPDAAHGPQFGHPCSMAF